MPAVEVAYGAVQGRIHITKIKEITATLAILGGVQLVVTLRSADVVNLLRPGISRLEVQALLETMGKSELAGVVEGEADVAVDAGAAAAGNPQIRHAQRLVVEGVGGDGEGIAVHIFHYDGIGRTGQGGHERRIDSQPAEVMGAHVIQFQDPALSQVALNAKVPLLVVRRVHIRGHGRETDQIDGTVGGLLIQRRPGWSEASAILTLVIRKQREARAKVRIAVYLSGSRSTDSCKVGILRDKRCSHRAAGGLARHGVCQAGSGKG